MEKKPVQLLRRQRLADIMRRKKISALLITNLLNLRYLSGLECSFGYLLCTKTDAWLITDGRYTADARANTSDIEIIEFKAGGGSPGEMIRDVLKGQRISKLGFESGAMGLSEYRKLKKNLGKIRLVEAGGMTEDLRLIKDDSEVALIRKACRKTDEAFKAVLDFIKPGITERTLRSRLEMELISREIDRLAFDTIIASGPNGAFAHAKPSDRKIRNGDFIVMDFGVRVDGYHSDMTRTVFVGKPTAEDRRRYNAVNTARQKALNAARPGVKTADLDAVARDYLKECDLGQFFIHSLGHGVGLDVHEEPRLSPTATQVLEPGMIITIEPGVYEEDWGGVRVEDTCLVTESGTVTLTKSRRTLISL